MRSLGWQPRSLGQNVALPGHDRSYPGRAVTDVGAASNPGSLVSARITPLRLEAFEQLPKHARRCVFWEVDPSTLGGDDHLSRPGVREGSLAVDGDAGVGIVRADRLERAAGSAPTPPMTIAETAPTRRAWATRSMRRPAPCRAHGCSPADRSVADAVLLTSLGVKRGATSAQRRRPAAELDRRGRRRIWCAAVCGRWRRSAAPRRPPNSAIPAWCPPTCAPVVEVLGDCSVDQCILDVDFLEQVGFVEVSQAPVLPAAAPRAGERAGLEGRCRGRAGTAAGMRETEAARRRGREHLLTD